MITAHRYHDFSCGHRVYGHESKCAHLHGHNYRITFEVTMSMGGLDDVGRVVDFSIIKTQLCDWLEREWDHRMLIWEDDPILDALVTVDTAGVVAVPFNPTAENMAQYLVDVVGPRELSGYGVVLTKVTVQETVKCGATVYAGQYPCGNPIGRRHDNILSTPPAPVPTLAVTTEVTKVQVCRLRTGCNMPVICEGIGKCSDEIPF